MRIDVGKFEIDFLECGEYLVVSAKKIASIESSHGLFFSYKKLSGESIFVSNCRDDIIKEFNVVPCHIGDVIIDYSKRLNLDGLPRHQYIDFDNMVIIVSYGEYSWL